MFLLYKTIWLCTTKCCLCDRLKSNTNDGKKSILHNGVMVQWIVQGICSLCKKSNLYTWKFIDQMNWLICLCITNIKNQAHFLE